MIPEPCIWVFTGAKGRFPGGVFTEIKKDEIWIHKNELSGTLTAYPLDVGCFDWAIANDCTSMGKETVESKRSDPELIGSFTTASLEHFHYETGLKQ